MDLGELKPLLNSAIGKHSLSLLPVKRENETSDAVLSLEEPEADVLVARVELIPIDVGKHGICCSPREVIWTKRLSDQVENTKTFWEKIYEIVSS